MFVSLGKILLFIAIVAALAMGANYLLESDGQLIGNLQATINGVEYTLSPLQSVIALMVLVVLIWITLKVLGFIFALLRFINGDDTAITRYFNRNRRAKGYRLLEEGMLALAQGDSATALARAERAGALIQEPRLTNLLAAQAAEQMGDTRKAEEIYKRLITDDKTRFVGVKGIMQQRLNDGDKGTALALAKKAFEINPKHKDTQNTLLQLQAGAGDWSGARETLKAKLKSGDLTRDVHKRRDAVLALSEAKGVLDEGNDIAGREAAIEANRLSPDLVPAAVMAARSYIENGKPKYAARVLQKSWESQPHPDLAKAYSEIAPDETAAARLKRFVNLTKGNAQHRESMLVMAELNLAAEDYAGARKALGKLMDTDADARVYTIMAAIERGEGADDAVIKGWLAKAVTASRGPEWVCDNCHTTHAEWAPVCGNCEAFDTLSWRALPTSGQEIISGALTMLPLIVGAPAIADLAEVEIEDAEDTVEAPEAEDAEIVEETVEEAKS